MNHSGVASSGARHMMFKTKQKYGAKGPFTNFNV